MPADLLVSRSSPGTPPAQTPDGAETLFTCHTSRIISFSPPMAKGLLAESKQRKDAQDEEPVGVLPWGSHTERTLSTGSLRLYKVPGSTAFLQSGRTIHAIMSKSRCWCVDGESKFVLRIRGNNYYRIELPNATTEDQDAVADFKVVLDRILQYETTPCPFKRSFYIELPEKPDVIFKPWKPKHSPITARQAEDEPAQSEDGSLAPEVEIPLHVEKRTVELRQKSPVPDRSPQDSGEEENVYAENAIGIKQSTAYVEGVVSNYETLKKSQRQREGRAATEEPLSTSSISEDEEKVETRQPGIAEDSLLTPPALHQGETKRSASPEAKRSNPSSAGNSTPPTEAVESDHSASAAEEIIDFPAEADIHNSVSRSANVLTHHDEATESIETSPPKPRRSFTAPIPYQHRVPSPVSSSSSEQQDEVITADVASSSSSTRSASPEKESIPSGSVEPEEGSDTNTSEPDPTDAGSSREEGSNIERPASPELSSSEHGSSTPEWLDLSAPGTPQVHSQSRFQDHDETRGSAGGLDDLDDEEASPKTHLRRRFQQRRELSPMPSLTVLHVPSREHPALDVAVVLFRSVCRTLLVLFLQIVLLLMSLASRLLSRKTGAGNLASSERNFSEDAIYEHSDSDSIADDFASVMSDIASEDDFGVPLEGPRVEKRRASSGVKLRKQVMRSRTSSAHSAK